METARTRVKICGITCREDAEAAIASGADALGFNFHRGSKRFIDREAAGAWIAELPALVGKVAVLVDAPVAQAEDIARLPWIDALQFHGCEDENYCRHFCEMRVPFIKAFGVQNRESLLSVGRLHTRTVLLDAYQPGGFGGSGRTFDWDLATEFVARHPGLCVILSGGLTPANVGDAVRRVRPYAVDVASGVESAPGRKDHAKMRDFIAEARGA